MIRPVFVISGTRLWIIIALAFSFISQMNVNGSTSVQVAWDANPETNIEGYRIYWGENGSGTTNIVDAGNSTTGSVTNLSYGTSYFFYVTAYNSFGLESDPSAILNHTPVAPTPPSIVSPTPAPDATLDSDYYHPVIATGTGSMTFSAFGLPPGVFISTEDGVISGRPSSLGTFSGVVSVSNGTNPNATQPFTITVSEAIVIPLPMAPTITSSPPVSSATLGIAYDHAVTATGSDPITFSANGLPPGLGIDPNGVITGSPTSEGTYDGQIVVGNGTWPDATQAFSIIVDQPAGPIQVNIEGELLAISPAEFHLPARIEGGTISSTEIVWQQLSGPVVVNLLSDVLSPLAQLPTVGDYSFRIQVSDGSTFDQSTVSIKVLSAPLSPPSATTNPLTMYPLQFLFDGVGIYWDSTANAYYHLGIKPDLNVPYWILLEADIPSHGDSYTYWVDDSIELNQTGFYTVFEER